METLICKNTSFHTVWEGMSRFSGLCDASLFFTFKLGRYRHHAKLGQATLNQIKLRSFATCRMKVLTSVSRNFRDGLSGPANVFLRVILASEVWIVSILNYLDKISQDQLGLFGFIGPTKTSPGYIGLNTINNFVVCLCFFLFDGKNRGL